MRQRAQSRVTRSPVRSGGLAPAFVATATRPTGARRRFLSHSGRAGGTASGVEPGNPFGREMATQRGRR